MDHGHDHGHVHAAPDFGRAFAIGIGLNLAFVLVEAGYGLRAGSLALVADAGHNLSDVLGLALAWGAASLARRLPTARRTYGLRRSSVLAALLNAVLLLVAIGGIAVEAIQRLIHPAPVSGGVVMVVAAVGILVNTVTALLFVAGRKHDLNIRGAFLHMAADAAVSAAVVLAGVAIRATGRLWIDPVMSLVIVVVILIGTWGLLRDSVNLALDAVPEGIDIHAVEEYLRALPGVSAVHDLHVWGMSTTDSALTAHLVRSATGDDDAFLTQVAHDLHHRFGIEHPTLQVERAAGSCACALVPANGPPR